MSVEKAILLRCDEASILAPGDPCRMTYGPSARTVAETRKRARRGGWRYVSGHPTTGPGRDICPEHPAPQRPAQQED